jgi:glycoside/pentoside/hexuronide:cation symporter, GPH family
MSARVQKLSFFEKAGYSLGDAAANFVFMTMILFQLTFYTDTMGLPAFAAGTLLLVGRLWDAFFDPFMGVLADRTNTRWGKFRPWVLWTAVPWGIVMVLAFTVPNFNPTGLLLYAILTNILLMTLYSANNTPYSALTGVMTADVNERTSLSAYRFFAAMFAQLIVGGFTLPLVAKFGHGDSARGWQMTMGLWAVLSLVFFVVTFLSVRERVQPPPTQKSSPREDFRNLAKNGPWIAMFVLTLAHFTYVAMRGGAMVYYFNYYVDQTSLLAFLDRFGLGTAPVDGHGLLYYLMSTFGLYVNEAHTNIASVGFSFFQMSQQAVTILGVLASTFLAMRFGKKAVALVCFVLATILAAAFILMPADAIAATYVLEWVRALAYAPTIPLIWAMFADVADYGEWTNGRRTTGVVFATIMFGLKAGLSLGGAIAGWLLSGYGYVANVAQTPHALRGIRLTVSVYPALFLLIVVVSLLFYKITKELNIRIQDELAERRRQYQPAPVAASP